MLTQQQALSFLRSLIIFRPVQMESNPMSSPQILDELVITSDKIDKMNIHMMAHLLRECLVRKFIFDADNVNEKNLEILTTELTHHTTLKTVVFRGCLFTNRDLHCVATMIRQSTCIRTLCIDRNVFGISHEGAVPLIAAIRGNIMIKRFAIMNGSMDHQTIRAIGDMIRHSRTLEEISLKGCPLEARDIECLANGFRYNMSIQRINLMDTGIADDSLPYILNIIENSSGLRELHIQNTRMTAIALERIQYLAKSISRMQVFV